MKTASRNLFLFMGEKSAPNYIALDTVSRFLNFQKIGISKKDGFKFSKLPKIVDNSVVVIDIENWFEKSVPPFTQIKRLVNTVKHRSESIKIILLARKISARKVCDLYRYGLDECFLSPIDYVKVNTYLQNIAVKSTDDHIDNIENLHSQESAGAVLKACQAVESTMGISELLDQILDWTIEGLKAEQGSILLYDEKSDTLKMLSAHGLPGDVIAQGYIPRKGSIAEWVMDKNEPLILNDAVRNDTRFTSIVKTRFIRSSMSVPLRVKGEVIGVMNIMRAKSKVIFSQDDLNNLLILASQAAIAIENQRLYEENLKSTRLAAIGGTISDISHCMKNMLTGIKGGLSLCEMSFQNADVELHDKGWDILKRNVERIHSLVHDMLDYSKARIPEREPVKIEMIVKDVVSNFKAILDERSIITEIKAQKGIGEISIDYNKIYRGLLNIFSNAIDALEELPNKKIEIQAMKVTGDYIQQNHNEEMHYDDYLLISIQDNGVGISDENLAHLFEPFFSTKSSKGTGLGCAVTKKIIEEHDGHIFVKSTHGKGTTFTIILPYID